MTSLYEIGIVIDPGQARGGIQVVEKSLSGLDKEAEKVARDIQSVLSVKDQGANQNLGRIADTLERMEESALITDARISQIGKDINERGLRRFNDGLETSRKTAGDLGRTLRTVFAGVVAGLGVRQFARFSDELQNVQNRLRLVTSGEEDLISTQRRLFEVANETRTSFEGTATIFTRLAQNQEQLGKTNQELLGFTESLNKAIILSGASAQEASAGLIQLSQGIASGALRGDELRSVLEQLPAVARVIADDLGIGVGELRKLGEEGAITADVILGAFERAGPRIAQQFETTIPTIGQSFQQLRNTTVEVIGIFNEGSNVARSFAESVAFVSSKLKEYATVVNEALGPTTHYADASSDVGRQLVSLRRELTQLEKVYEQGGRTNEVAAARISQLRETIDGLTGSLRNNRQEQKALQEEEAKAEARKANRSEASENVIAALLRENELLQLSATERKVQEELYRVEAELIREKVDLTSESGSAVLREAEAIIRANVAREQTIERLKEEEQARDRAAKAAQREADRAARDEERKRATAEREAESFRKSVDQLGQIREERQKLLDLRAQEPELIAQIDAALENLRLKELEGQNTLAAGIERASIRIKQEAEDLAAVGEKVVGVFADRGTEALIEFAQTGRLQFREFASSVLEDIQRIIARLLIVQALNAVLPGSGSAAGPVSGGLNSGRAGGGTVQPGQRPFPVGELGTEMFVPDRTGTIVPAPQAAAKPSVNVLVMVVKDEDEAKRKIAGGDYDEVIFQRLGANPEKVRQVAAG